jgi:hypothetical protein
MAADDRVFVRDVLPKDLASFPDDEIRRVRVLG